MSKKSDYGTKYKITTKGTIVALSEERFDELWEEQKNNYTYDKNNKLINPYPTNIFIGTTLEGKSGQALNRIFEYWREQILKELNQ